MLTEGAGHGRKKKLIDAVHRLQPARLTTAVFKQEGENILDQLMTLSLYLDASPGGSDPDSGAAAKVGASKLKPLLRPRTLALADTDGPATQFAEKIIAAISLENSKINASKLESELETQDRQASNFYGGADLSHDAVVAATSSD